MGKHERESKRFNLRRLTEVTLATVAVAGGGTMVLAGWDKGNVYQKDKESFTLEMDKNYPLLSNNELKISRDRIIVFENRSREFVKSGHADQIPAFANESGVVFDYAKVSEDGKNKAIRNRLFEDSGLSQEYMQVVISGIWGGIISYLGASYFVEKGIRAVKQRLKKNSGSALASA